MNMFRSRALSKLIMQGYVSKFSVKPSSLNQFRSISSTIPKLADSKSAIEPDEKPEKLKKLCDELLALDVLEVNQLLKLIQVKKIKIKFSLKLSCLIVEKTWTVR
jgi:hypothetical protein